VVDGADDGEAGRMRGRHVHLFPKHLVLQQKIMFCRVAYLCIYQKLIRIR